MQVSLSQKNCMPDYVIFKGICRLLFLQWATAGPHLGWWGVVGDVR